MKRFAIIPVIFLVAALTFGESVWSGNAAVGGTSDFPGESGLYRGLSNSFPPGTMLKVTNPRNDKTVDVIVAGLLDTPGVFILLEPNAGDLIELPTDLVVPVKVSPIVVIANAEGYEVDSELLSTGDSSTPIDADSGIPISPETIIAYEIPLEDEDFVAEEVSIEEAVMEEDLILEETVVKEGDKVFFLMPSDPKPPENTEVSTDVPMYTDDGSKLSVNSLIKIEESMTGTFVQIGAYESFAIMDEAASEISLAAPGYPLGFAENDGKIRYIYKLLVGPLGPAEVGIVLETARNTAFPDAFRYIQ